MNFNFKKILIVGLVAIFFVSAIMCCCFTDTVHAEAPTPSCHQTEHEPGSSQNSEECGCDQSLAIIKKNVASNNTLVAVATLVIEQQSEIQVFDYTNALTYQAPPQLYDTLPLTIKYSILRI